jgi:hypothetical protein
MAGSRVAVVVVGLAVAWAGGCGGGSDEACGRVRPCGGEVVGTWKLASACSTAPPVPAKLCAAATVKHSSFGISGTMKLGADLGYSVDTTQSGTIEVSVPGSCLTIGGATATCDQITPQVSVGVNVRCFESSDGCLCTFVVLPHPVSVSGTYSTSGSMLIDTPAGGAPETLGYCVAGDSLHLITLGPGATAAADPLVIGDMVGIRENH